MTLSVLVETSHNLVSECRLSLLAGGTHVPASLGLSGRAPHIERGERDALVAALPALVAYAGAAARVIEAGPFAGHLMAPLLDALERPKAGVIMTSNLDKRQFARLMEIETTAQVTHVDHDATVANWPLETIGIGRTLLLVGGGGFGLTPPVDALALLDNASHALEQDDLIVLTLEMARDGATLETLYTDFGSHIVTQALTSLGRSEGLVARSFFDAPSSNVRFGALAQKDAAISWNGLRCVFEEGSWLNMGAMALHASATTAAMHPAFEVHYQWHSHDKAVTLLLLRKI